MSFLSAIAFFLAFAFFVVVQATMISFAAAMRRHYPDLWRTHTSPSWLSFGDSPWAAVRFIRSPTYQAVREPRVLALGRRLVALQKLLAAVFLAILLLVGVLMAREYLPH